VCKYFFLGATPVDGGIAVSFLTPNPLSPKPAGGDLVVSAGRWRCLYLRGFVTQGLGAVTAPRLTLGQARPAAELQAGFASFLTVTPDVQILLAPFIPTPAWSASLRGVPAPLQWRIALRNQTLARGVPTAPRGCSPWAALKTALGMYFR
jgi:hypothetical protein